MLTEVLILIPVVMTIAPRSGFGLRARLALRHVPEVSAELPAADDDEVE